MDSSALQPGSRLSELEILRVLAVGGFGIVYLARDHSLDRDVALKEFMPSRLVGRTEGMQVAVRSLSDAETFALGLKSFVNEAKLLARFSHPAMVKVYRFWEANGTAYMVMPYLRGPTLTDVRRSMSEPPTEAWLRSIVNPLLDALALLHSQGVYHRDVAPDNVLLSGAGLPVLLDFGAARHLIGDRTRLITAVLKPHYAPIEQYAESSQLRQGPWTDLYALGALVTYLLDGSPPLASTARAIHDERPALAARCIPNVSAQFLSAIDWALAVRPQDRPQSVAELRNALGRGVVSPAKVRQPAASVARVPTHAFRPLLATAVVLIAAAIGSALWLRAPSDAAPAHAEVAVAVEPTMSSVDPPFSLLASDPVAGSPVPAPTVAASSAHVVKTHRSSAKTPAPSGERTGQKRKVGATHVAVRGPNELCADRNFFVRPFCIRRLCDESRFKARAECAPPSRQAALPG
jgi:serine/threonine protein kinase